MTHAEFIKGLKALERQADVQSRGADIHHTNETLATLIGFLRRWHEEHEHAEAKS